MRQYSNGLYDRSDAAEKGISNLLKQIHDIHADGVKHEKAKIEDGAEYLFYDNTADNVSLANLKNRLVLYAK